MLSVNCKKNISKKLGLIYKGIYSNKDLEIYTEEIFRVIKNSNKKSNKKKF